MSARQPLIRPGPRLRNGNAAAALARGESGALADLEPAWAAGGSKDGGEGDGEEESAHIRDLSG